ncbi:unnamed protein product [Orchesella dallaii]|uniref:Uncharacterized protein n=1 Tax=Orchesella dallaii TaxID=48710 RepID=A0ABP1PXP1_9HEXA
MPIAVVSAAVRKSFQRELERKFGVTATKSPKPIATNGITSCRSGGSGTTGKNLSYCPSKPCRSTTETSRRSVCTGANRNGVAVSSARVCSSSATLARYPTVSACATTFKNGRGSDNIRSF